MSMNSVFVDSPVGDDERRRLLYDGQLFVYSKRPAVAAFRDFARGLVEAGVEIYASGGTRRHLEEAGIKVRELAAYTGFPEMMDGRIKTLHPKIHGGILCRRDNPADMLAIARDRLARP